MRVLLARLDGGYTSMETWNRYYENSHPLSFFDDAVRVRFGNRFSRFCSNFSQLVVDSEAERFVVQGFAFSDDTNGDEDVWALWQSNNLDAWSQSAHTDALVKGRAYTLIDPNNGDPRITVEDAMHTIVALDPRDSRKRLAGLKRWIDPSDGKLIVVVYLSDFVWKYRSMKSWPTTYTPWLNSIESAPQGATIEGSPQALPVNVPAGGFEPYQSPDDDDWPLRNTLGVVPLVRLPNRPRLSGEWAEGRSEIQAISSNQDLVNYYRAMAAIGARYMALPQRWATNMDTDIDSRTGQPKPPFQGGLADLWVVPPMEEDDPRALQAANQVAFGQFAAADLDPFIKLIEWEVGAMASIARMPYYFLLGGESGTLPPSGESQNASEAAFVRKVDQQSVFFGEGWEETMRVALKAKGDKRANRTDAETIWGPIATVNIAVRSDAIVKQRQQRIIDLTQSQIELGYSPQTRRRMQKALAAEPPPPTAPKFGAVNGAGGSQQAVGSAMDSAMNGGTTDSGK